MFFLATKEKYKEKKLIRKKNNFLRKITFFKMLDYKHD